MIKFSIRDVPTIKGLDIHRTIPKEGIGLSDEEIDIRSLIKIDAHVSRVDEVLIAQTQIEADYGFLCARCLVDVKSHQQKTYTITFDIDPEVEYYDLGEEIRQELIMDNPARILCKDDCRGICPGCGKNLNNEQCQCSK